MTPNYKFSRQYYNDCLKQVFAENAKEAEEIPNDLIELISTFSKGDINFLVTSPEFGSNNLSKVAFTSTEVNSLPL